MTPPAHGCCTGTRPETIRTCCIARILPRASASPRPWLRSAAPRSSAASRDGERGDAYGLVDPETIIVLFPKDAARPPLSFALGHRASDGLGRYLLMPDGGEIVTIPDVQLAGLIELAEALDP